MKLLNKEKIDYQRVMVPSAGTERTVTRMERVLTRVLHLVIH